MEGGGCSFIEATSPLRKNKQSEKMLSIDPSTRTKNKKNIIKVTVGLYANLPNAKLSEKIGQNGNMVKNVEEIFQI